MDKLKRTIVFGFGFYLLLLSEAIGQDSISDTMTIDAGPAYLQAMEELLIYDRPPSGFLWLPGKQISTTNPNETYAITGRTVNRALGNDIWVRIAPVGADGSIQAAESGWVHWDHNIDDTSVFLVTPHADGLE